MVDRGFAADTNLLIYPTTRRLLHGIALETGQKIYVLPEVYREIVGKRHIAECEITRFQRRARGEESPANEVEHAIESASIAWFNQECLSERTPFRLLSRPDGESDWRNIAQTIPSEVFKKQPARDSFEGDPLILAQAINFDVEVLGSNNLNSIEHELFNSWLLNKGWNRPLIHTASEMIQALSENDLMCAYSWLMVHGTNRVFKQDSENRTEFARTLRILERGGFRRFDKRQDEDSDTFKTIVYHVERFFEIDPRFSERFERAIYEHREKRASAIALELVLNERVNQAVAQALEATK